MRLLIEKFLRDINVLILNVLNRLRYILKSEKHNQNLQIIS